jgi:predicted nucleic-acid-binding protein
VIGLDTNVLVRYVVRDDTEQTLAADALIDGFTTTDPGYVSHVTLVELWWVLTSTYKQDTAAVAALIDQLVAAATITVQAPDVVHAALRAVLSNRADFADAVIAGVGAAGGCAQTKTFDRRAAGRAGMTLLTWPKT